MRMPGPIISPMTSVNKTHQATAGFLIDWHSIPEHFGYTGLNLGRSSFEEKRSSGLRLNLGTANLPAIYKQKNTKFNRDMVPIKPNALVME